MTTNIAIDPDKLTQIMPIKPFKSKKEVVDMALEAYLRLLRQQQALSLKGSKVWQGDLDQMRLDRGFCQSVYFQKLSYYFGAIFLCLRFLPSPICQVFDDFQIV